MGKRGRPALGAGLVEKLGGSELAKRRLAVILRTLGGDLTVDRACAELGVKRSAFNKLRAKFLADAAGLLEPRPAGRRPHVPTEAEVEARRLQRENAQLRLDLRAGQIREEIALVMPHLLKPAGSRGKKTARPAPNPAASTPPDLHHARRAASKGAVSGGSSA